MAVGFAAQAFSSADAFLASECVRDTRCLILDIAMPGMSGPELQRELASRRQDIPTIFITASADVVVRPRLLAEGAVHCQTCRCNAQRRAVYQGPRARISQGALPEHSIIGVGG